MPNHTYHLFLLALVAGLAARPPASRAEGFNAAQGSAPNQVSTDPYAPVSRGYIEPSIDDLGNGQYRVNVEGNYASPNTGMKLSLQAVVNDGTGKLRLIQLKEFTPKGTIFNPVPTDGSRQLYRSNTSYQFSAQEIDDELKKAFPNSNLRFTGGQQFFVHSEFDVGHRWGGTDRGGGITVPGVPSSAAGPLPKVPEVTSIDVNYPQNLIASTSIGKGLDPNGAIGSKIEMEGKWAVKDENSFRQVQDKLMALSKNPNLADASGNRILPAGWTISLEDRYVLRDPKLVSAANPQGYVLDSRGMPIADPMRDTASDTKDLKLAKSDSIVRARYTQQNNTTVINAKPGGDGFVVDKDGIVQRVEYSAAVAGGDPSRAKAFFESKHPLNFMQTVGHASGVQNPAEAVEIKSVEQAANRLKFLLKGPNGEIIEVSTDHVHAKSLMDPSIPPVEYFQMEADFEHRAVTGSIATAGQTNGIGSYNTPVDITKIDDPVQGPKILEALTANYKTDQYGNYVYKKDARGNYIRNPSGPNGYEVELDAANPKLSFDNAFLDGRPSLHTVESLRPDSGFMKANAAELEKAKVAMRAVRDYSIGANDWVPAANKIAMSNFLLGHIPETEASPSVQRQLAAMRARGWLQQTPVTPGQFNCATAYGKFAP